MRMDLVMLRFTLLSLTCLFLCSCATTRLENASTNCPSHAGFLDGPFVDDERTARRIALAIIEEIEKRSPPQHEYVLKILDGGAYWEAVQLSRSHVDAAEAVKDSDRLIVTAGGGGIEMRISKCDGAVSEVHYSR